MPTSETRDPTEGDLVALLRQEARYSPFSSPDWLLKSAADEIERLRSSLAAAHRDTALTLQDAFRSGVEWRTRMPMMTEGLAMKADIEAEYRYPVSRTPEEERRG